MTRPLRVLAWVPQPYDTSPGQRFRIEQWEPHLRREGIEIVHSPFLDEGLSAAMKARGAAGRKAAGILRATGRRLAEARRSRAFDLVYVFRESALMGPALAERILSASGGRHVFDFDDAVWIRYKSPANSYLSYLRMPGKTATSIRLSRHVLAGNDYLAAYARRYTDRVTVVPTTIDTDRYRPVERPEPAVPVIGWTGSYSTEQYLALVRPVFERLQAAGRTFRVVVVGDRMTFGAAGVQVEHRQWRAATEPEDLSDFDIGIMPLPDTPWERGKCGAKALQYMALGIPAVVSPVGVNADIVRHGENGLWARSVDEWQHALESLLGDVALRRRLGRAGRSTVEARYSARIQAPHVARILREAAAA